MQDTLIHLRTSLLRLMGSALSQKRVKLSAVLILPALLIAVIYLLPGSGHNTQAASSGLPAIHAPQDVANLPYDYQFIGQGQITGGSEEVWIIGNVPIRVAAHTQLASELHVGDFVVLTGRILQDKTWLADRIQLTQEDGTYFTFNGPLEMIQESLWQIGGHALVVNQQTEVEDGLTIGQILLTTFAALEDQTWVAMKIVAFDKFPEPPVTMITETLISTPTGTWATEAPGSNNRSEEVKDNNNKNKDKVNKGKVISEANKNKPKGKNK